MCRVWFISGILVLVSAAPARATPPGPAEASIDLARAEGCGLVGGQWRYHDARLVEVDFRSAGADRKPSGPPNRTYDVDPHAGAGDFDDSQWEVIDPSMLAQRRSAGKVCFAWYRIGLTLPQRVGDFDTAGSTAVFEIVVDDYAEVWVDGQLPRQIGQSGGSMVAGWNVPNRIVVAREVRPGQRVQIAVFAMNGPVSDPPPNYIWVRSARLDFYRQQPPSREPLPAGTIEALDAGLDAVLGADARLERVAGGFTSVEGPAWDRATRSLSFSDIPQNRIFRWREGSAVEVLLERSGYLGAAPFSGREPGSNGLTFDALGRLVICQHGERWVCRLEPDGSLTVLADRYGGRRLDGPNDAVYDSKGNLYITDPPFGLPGGFDDPARELDFSGVYRLSQGGRLTLLVDELAGPNGVALSPDERTLYVSNARPDRPVWMAYDLLDDGTAANGRVFFDASPWVPSRPGFPDGMKVDRAGRLFAAGPGGLYVFAPDGTHLGTVHTAVATSNCAWGNDGTVLYISADHDVFRLRTRTRGAGW